MIGSPLISEIICKSLFHSSCYSCYFFYASWTCFFIRSKLCLFRCFHLFKSSYSSLSSSLSWSISYHSFQFGRFFIAFDYLSNTFLFFSNLSLSFYTYASISVINLFFSDSKSFCFFFNSFYSVSNSCLSFQTASWFLYCKSISLSSSAAFSSNIS